MAWLWLIAGPNGSGKTTLLRRGLLHGAVPGLPDASLNADAVTSLLVDANVERATANLAAARLIDSVLADTVRQGRTVLVETVLSSDKYIPTVETARGLGMRVGLLFVTLPAGRGNVLRVRERVAGGGHDVPTDKVLDRRTRSHANLWRFADLADIALLFDNTELASPVLVASRTRGRWTLLAPGRLPDLDGELRRRSGA